ncbi:choline-sulfatase [Aestuariispira ectoiniformans]|uniref:choline-sulfatase n=1 Tax=Aestuariispira ectoiniformans TaxID=2775080 RepID=UPI00223A9073|nr:choline-sulfatase [Aestuariispira ectoiniformans]
MANREDSGPMNILILMADQLSAFGVGAYGNSVVKTPVMDRLAGEGVVFDNAYCNSPLCAPARFTMMTGQNAHRIGAYDNAAELPSQVLTYAHYLRYMGYKTSLAGKMHFIGPDQLHGFERRLTTDIYPADFGWAADWEMTDDRFDWWYHNMSSVKEAGVAHVTNQLDYDDEVGYRAVRELYDFARDKDPRPFMMTVSFTHPHDPYTTREKYWNLYDNDEIDLPSVPAIPYEDQDPHSKRLYHVSAINDVEITEQDIRNARRAYYGNTSYVDEWFGKIMDALENTGQADNTIVIVLSDHGDMLGERGLWYKMSYFERSCRIPFIVHAPGRFEAKRVANNVSHIDLLPTLVDLAGMTGGVEKPDYPDPVDGRSLLGLLNGKASDDEDEAIGEYMGEGSVAPVFMIRRGRYKYISCDCDPAQLYDLEADPNELSNLSGHSDYADLEAAFEAEVAERWSVEEVSEAVMRSQRIRHLIFKAMTKGEFTPWDFQPFSDASQQFMRNHMDLNKVEAERRYPPAKGV